jgi:hypothetical protein
MVPIDMGFNTCVIGTLWRSPLARMPSIYKAQSQAEEELGSAALQHHIIIRIVN